MKINTVFKKAYVPKVEDFVLATKEDGTIHVFKIKEQKFQGKEIVMLIPINHVRKNSVTAEYAPNREQDMAEGRATKEVVNKIKPEYKVIKVVSPEDIEMTFNLPSLED